MKTVRVAELKAHLSAHLRLASNGEEIVVLDRNTPIARIVPLAEPEHTNRRERLIAQGVLQPARRAADEQRYMPNPVQPDRTISRATMEAIWEEERTDRV